MTAKSPQPTPDDRHNDTDITIRAMAAADVEPSWRCAEASLRAMAVRYSPHSHQATPATPQRLRRGYARVRVLLDNDPAGAWVAQAADGRVVGVAQALTIRRLWFLSLLAVDVDLQARGVGARLLDVALSTVPPDGAAWILASPDPRALRRYAHAGFALHPGYAAVGHVDRSRLPAGLGVRDGDLDRDRDLVEAVTTALRGADHGPYLDRMVAAGRGLLVVDGEGYAIPRHDGATVVAARTPSAASRLLWAALAQADHPDGVELDHLTGRQQWAIEVALAARLSLFGGQTSAERGMRTPTPSPYLPSGAYG